MPILLILADIMRKSEVGKSEKLGLLRDEFLWFFRKTNVYSQYHATGGWGINSRSARRLLEKMAPNDRFKVSNIGVNIIVFEEFCPI